MLNSLKDNRRFAFWLCAAIVAGVVVGAVISAARASATGTPGGPSFTTCPNLTGWYVNPDEGDRKPDATAAGLKFTDSDLIHHAANLPLAQLTPGSYHVADGSAGPDQTSFFSVEVRNEDNSGYATLRWNTASSKWNMVVGGNLYEDADPVVLTHKTTPAKGQIVVSFGVGYTLNPPGTVHTTIDAVTFKGTTYPLTCAPVSPSASASTSASPKPTGSVAVSPYASASNRHPASSAPAGGVPGASNPAPPALAVTGFSAPAAVGVGAALLVAGGVLLFVLRRRRITFTS